MERAGPEVAVLNKVLEYVVADGYLLLGPVFWTGMLAVMFAERRRMLRPVREAQKLPCPTSHATILVPARNEEKSIARCIASCLAQEYAAFNVVAVDDRSTDQTGAILDQMASADARLRVVHVEDRPLPADWTGKNHALWQGVQQATGDWLLFVDSDAMVQPKALATMIAGAEARSADLVSLVPCLRTPNFWERLIVPVAGLFAAILDRGLHEPYAYGWFMLVRRRMYDKVGGHAAIRDVLNDDKVLAACIRKAGGKPRVWWGSDFAALCMDRTPMEIVRGLARNFYVMTPGKPWRALFCLTVVSLCGFSAFAALAWGLISMHWGWIAAADAHLLAMGVVVACLYRWGGNRAWIVLALPLALVMSALIFLFSIWTCLTGNKVQWRATHYQDSAGSATQISDAPRRG
jgi:glycosyltransferase involved in cell wall biosynthesis